ncbi:MAG: sigma 54-interacting transcriptional regulator [Gammaproteobacteria bacterium]|nr:sigma 54-interacting transcriptional regulator [Gammaproteobacteria bacterium]
MSETNAIVALLEHFLQPLSEGVIVCNRSGQVLTVNAAVRRLFGIPAGTRHLTLSDLNGHNLRSSLIRAGLDTAGELEHHCETVMSFDEEINVDGRHRWFHVDSSLLDIPDSGEQLRMIVMRDITAEKRLDAVMGDKEASGFVSEDPDMLRLIERLHVVSASNASVLFQGESGTGKTELARLVHKLSARSAKPFIELNCGAIPASLIETELFGHVKGAFTGAVKSRPGRFKAADGGTLFLDEISELPYELQAKLLRVLQSGEYEPVGSDRTETVDVRLVSASNQDLSDLVDNHSFRADLYYRVAVVPLHVPPLRDRPGDIPILIDALIQRLAERGYPREIRFSNDAMQPVMNYPWPGNVRELANMVEHSLICAVDGIVQPQSLPDTLREYCDARRHTDSKRTPKINDRERIEYALQEADGNKTLAAQILKIDRSTLWRKMQRLGIE